MAAQPSFTEQDSQWLVDTIRELCLGQQTTSVSSLEAELTPKERFNMIYSELQNRGFILNNNTSSQANRASSHRPKTANSYSNSREAFYNDDSIIHNKEDDHQTISVPKMKKSNSPFAQVYSTLGVITESDFGTVMKVQNLIDKQFYALKIIKLSVDEIPAAMHEVQCLAHLRSSRLVRYFSSWIEENTNSHLLSFFIQTEFVEGQSLENFLRVQRKKSSKSFQKYVHKIFIDLIYALNEIHAAGIVHRDLRPSNIMFRSDGSIVVIGFGISSSLKNNSRRRHRELSPPNVMMTQRQAESLAIIDQLDMLCISAADTAACSSMMKLGSPIYASPQQLNGRKSCPADDIYSFGIIMFEILAQFANNESAKTRAIKTLRNMATLPENFRIENQQESDLILQMTNHNVQNRPNAQQILQSDLFKKWKEDVEADAYLRNNSNIGIEEEDFL